MAEHMSMTFVATGANYGKTFKWQANAQSPRSYSFVDGKFRVSARPDQLQTLGRYLANNLCAFPEGSPELETALRLHNGQLFDDTGARRQGPDQIQGGRGSPGASPSAQSAANGSRDGSAEAGGVLRLPGGDGLRSSDAGQAEETLTFTSRIQEAVRKLDPKDDASWTEAGLPTVSAVAHVMGNNEITRPMISAAMPGYTRDMAALS